MVTGKKKTAAKKSGAAKNSPTAKKVPAAKKSKSTAAKKKSPLPKHADDFEIGDIVVIQDGTKRFGRICSFAGFGQANVMVASGCTIFSLRDLSPAPPGSTAPACEDC